MRLKVTVELELKSGPELPEEDVLDFFAGTIGRENAAPKPLRLTIDDRAGGVASIYEVVEVDAA